MKTTEERFWEKVNMNSGFYGIDGSYPTECWEWIGAKMTQGYGHMRINGKNRQAHRILFDIRGYKLSSDDCILHKCDNRLCVNPKHLFIGSRRQNAKDAASKGRSRGAIGIKNANSKLNDKIVREIRNDAELGVTYKSLADKFGVSRPTISAIINGKTWKHVV